MVFSWHFTLADTGFPVPFAYAPSVFVFSLLDEGHSGVSLFMALSGYLFAKLLDGRRIDYKAFFWNRFLRLAPLLMLVIILFALVLRILLHYERGQIQSLAYWTIIGRIDQFLLGMLAFQYRNLIADRTITAIGGLTAFSLFYWHFDLLGGFYQNPSYPSPGLIWIFLPTLEGLAYSLAIAYYDNSFWLPNNGLSRFIGQMGSYSYSIYLLHFFVVFRMARFINDSVTDISNFYLSCLCSLVCFILMMPVGYVSFRFIEAPFLKLRKRFTIETIGQERPEQGCVALSKAE